MTALLPDDGEHLTTGWEPEVPPSDSLVRQAVLAHASWAVEGARRAGRPWRRAPGWAGGYLGDHSPLVNWVVLLAPRDLPATLAEVETLVPAPAPYLLISPWPTGDLTPFGLTRLGHPPLMVRLPAPDPASRPATDLEVREVSAAEELALAERVIVEGYPLPELQPLRAGDLFSPLLLDGPTRVWVAWDRDRPVAASLAHHAAGATLVELVAVLPVARGRGAGAAVTWSAAVSEPGAPAVLIASDDGQPVYERLGFLRVERWTVWARA